MGAHNNKNSHIKISLRLYYHVQSLINSRITTDHDVRAMIMSNGIMEGWITGDTWYDTQNDIKYIRFKNEKCSISSKICVNMFFLNP